MAYKDDEKWISKQEFAQKKSMEDLEEIGKMSKNGNFHFYHSPIDIYESRYPVRNFKTKRAMSALC